MAYNVNPNPSPFRTAGPAGPGFPPPSPGAGPNRGVNPAPQRGRSSRGGKWGWVVLIILAVILIKSGIIGKIREGASNLMSNLLNSGSSAVTVQVQPAQHSTEPLISIASPKVSLGEAAANYRNVEQEYHSDGVYTVDAKSAQTLELSWPAGAVSVRPYDGEEVRITEFAEGGVDEAQALRCGMDGTTLFIQYCSRDAASNKLPEKTLEVLLPRALADAALFAKLEAGSGALTVEDLALTDASFSCASGSITANALRAAGTLTIETGSGDTALSGEIGNLRFSSSSGNLRFSGGEAMTTISASSSSGDLLLSGSIHRAETHTSSGRIELASRICPYALTASTASGDVALSLPDDADFSLTYSTASGKLQSKLTVTESDGRYIRGDGIAAFSVSTNSGSLQLLPYIES